MHGIQAITIRSCPDSDWSFFPFKMHSKVHKQRILKDHQHQMQAIAIQFKSFRSTRKKYVVLYPSWIHKQQNLPENLQRSWFATPSTVMVLRSTWCAMQSIHLLPLRMPLLP